MAATNPTYHLTFSVPGLDEKPPRSYMDGYGPNCDACKEFYLGRPLFSPCDTCAGSFEEMLAIEEASRRDANEAPPRLDADPAGGLFLRVV